MPALEITMDELMPRSFDPPPPIGSSVADWIAYRAALARGEREPWCRQFLSALLPPVVVIPEPGFARPPVRCRPPFKKLPRIEEKPLLPNISVDYIIKLCAQFYGVKILDIISARRTADIVLPRQVAMYLAKECTPRSLPYIGRRIGGRDHTTVLSGVRKIARLIGTDAKLRAEVETIKAVILGADVDPGDKE